MPLGILLGFLLARVAKFIAAVLSPESISCANCKANLAKGVPVYSFLRQKGKCYRCRTGMSKAYLFMEFLAIISSACVFALPFSYIKIISVSLMILPLSVLSLHLLQCRKVPDTLLILFGFTTLLSAFLHNIPLIQALLIPVMTVIFLVLLNSVEYITMKRKIINIEELKIFILAVIAVPLEVLPSYIITCGIAGLPLAIIWRNIYPGKSFPISFSVVLNLLLYSIFMKGTGLT